MVDFSRPMQRVNDSLVFFETKTKLLFSGAALLLYFISLVQLVLEHPLTLNAFLVDALGKLIIPFSIILLQELLELITFISGNTLKSAQQQFQIVALVLLRSFFKDFAKLNEEVALGLFDEPVQKAIVKLLAIICMTALIMWFQRLSRKPQMQSYSQEKHKVNLYKEMVVIALIVFVLIDLIAFEPPFSVMYLISLVFTGMIVIDAAFFIHSISKGHKFSRLVFEGGMVISLVFARFALFANNILAYSLSVLGVAFATVSLLLFSRSKQKESADHAGT